MKNSVILDTDIGYDPDDLFALLLLLNSPEMDLNLIVTGDEVNGKRATFAKKVLDMYGRRDIKVVQGADLGHHDFVVDELIQDFSYSADKNYLEAMKTVLDASDKVVYTCIQGFTNLANLLKRFPESREKLVVYQMGGAVDYSRRPGWVEHNVKIDKEAARYVTKSGANISLVTAQTTFNLVYMVDDQHNLYKKLKSSDKPVYQMLARHVELFHEAKTFWPYMHDPLTVAAALGKDFVDFYESAVSMDEHGSLHKSSGTPKLHLSKPKSKDKEFMKFLDERLFP
ncbi:MAG: nucleoside hydrolase [Candidatus Nanoarchaeia archaeon]|nr:nucleoside hydrolase [Candidatus Nanoarchaeia archaeon]MDD5239109.1 nucleoside hydrolase [Candidatus Nanoarchaeia archaeon]